MASTTFSWQNGNGIKIFAREWPVAEPRGVIALVHGIGEHSGRYQHVAEVLNAAGYALISFDLPGHGQSSGTRGHLAFDDVLKEIDHLLEEAAKRYPGKPRFIFGHSLGGTITLYYTLKRRPAVQGVIVTSPSLAAGENVPASKVALVKLMSRIAPAFTLDNGVDSSNLSRDPNVIRIYNNDPLVHSKVSARLAIDILNSGPWILDNIRSVAGPLLLEVGSSDTIISVKAIQKLAESVQKDKITFKVWEGLCHETHNEPEKQQVMQYMVDWLNDHR